MSSNVGLSTPRGSGTSGYVQRNLSALKPRAVGVGAPYPPPGSNDPAARRLPRVRKPDENILRHDRLRQIEIEVLQRREELEDKGNMDEEKMDDECDALRAKLVADFESGKERGRGTGAGGAKGRTKAYQVHELAEAKAKESEKLRRALGLRAEDVGARRRDGEDGKDGEQGGDDEDEHPMAKQERRKREREIEREREREAELIREREREKDRERDTRRRDEESSDDSEEEERRYRRRERGDRRERRYSDD